MTPDEFSKAVDDAAQPIVKYYTELINAAKTRAEGLSFLMQLRVDLGQHYLANGVEPTFKVTPELVQPGQPR